MHETRFSVSNLSSVVVDEILCAQLTKYEKMMTADELYRVEYLMLCVRIWKDAAGCNMNYPIADTEAPWLCDLVNMCSYAYAVKLQMGSRMWLYHFKEHASLTINLQEGCKEEIK